MTDKEFEELEKRLFLDKLGLSEEQIPEARTNLLGFFETLFVIDERLKKEKVYD